MKPVHGLIIAVAVIGFITYTKSTTGTNPVSSTANQITQSGKTTEQLWLESKPIEPTQALLAIAPTSTPKKKGVK